jgi:formylglycine-generating enzyme required for sulfatase activity
MKTCTRVQHKSFLQPHTKKNKVARISYVTMSITLTQILLLLTLTTTVIHAQPRMTSLNGGDFRMGIDDQTGRNGEAPSYMSAVKAFKLDVTPVTNKHWM